MPVKRDRHTSMRPCVVVLLPLMMSLLCATPAQAARNCTISMTSVSFGNVDLTAGTPIDVTGTITVTCSGFNNDPPRLCISIGMGTAGDSRTRKMQGVGTLDYDLYTNAGRTSVWGSWQTGYGTAGVQATGTDGTSTFTVYGRIRPSQQSVAAGTYTSAFTLDPFLRYGRTSRSSTCPGPLNDEQTASTSFTVSAIATGNCTVSAGNLSFGSVPSLTSNVDATSSISVQCSNGLPYNVGLGPGNGSGATVASRKMTSGASNVTYGLFSDASRNSVWGDTLGTNTVSRTGTGSSQPLTVYGRVPSQTTPEAGTYSDTVLVSVTY